MTATFEGGVQHYIDTLRASLQPINEMVACLNHSASLHSDRMQTVSIQQRKMLADMTRVFEDRMRLMILKDKQIAEQVAKLEQEEEQIVLPPPQPIRIKCEGDPLDQAIKSIRRLTPFVEH
jgi:hypothetical protein